MWRRETEGIPLAPRVQAQREAAQQRAVQVLASFRRALAPFALSPMPVGTRQLLCAQWDRIVGRPVRWQRLEEATHLLVSEDRANTLGMLWEMPVLGSPDVQGDDVVVGAYCGFQTDASLEGAQIRFRPIARVTVRWGQTGAVIIGVEIPVEERTHVG